MAPAPGQFPQHDPATPLVKVCGLTQPADAVLAWDLGAAFLGVIMTSKSPRQVTRQAAVGLLKSVRAAHPEARIVGVFVDEPAAEIAEAFRGLDLFAVQIHGPVEETARLLPPGAVMPALSIRDAADSARLDGLDAALGPVVADAFVADKAGGTGKLFDHALVQPCFPRRPIFVAGGLKPENFDSVVANLGAGPMPYAFDLSSGLEDGQPGIKSPDRLRDFFARYRRLFPAAGAGA